MCGRAGRVVAPRWCPVVASSRVTCREENTYVPAPPPSAPLGPARLPPPAAGASPPPLSPATRTHTPLPCTTTPPPHRASLHLHPSPPHPRPRAALGTAPHCSGAAPASGSAVLWGSSQTTAHCPHCLGLRLPVPPPSAPHLLSHIPACRRASSGLPILTHRWAFFWVGGWWWWGGGRAVLHRPVPYAEFPTSKTARPGSASFASPPAVGVFLRSLLHSLLLSVACRFLSLCSHTARCPLARMSLPPPLPRSGCLLGRRFR